MVISYSGTVNLVGFGYNADEVWLPQVNITLFSATDTGLPLMIRVLPGLVRDVATPVRSLQEIDITWTNLVLDREFVLEANKTLLREARIPFVLPQRRNSTWYETQIHLIDHFFYHKQLIRAGRTLIASAMTAEPREVYDLYKSRNLIEDHFVAFRGLIQADNRYLRDATAVFGHVFVGFLCLYLYCRILNRIKQAGMTAHLSPQGLLLKLSKVYAVENEGEGRPPRCPNRSRRSRRNSNSTYSLMDEKLGFKTPLSLRDSDRAITGEKVHLI
ncbi:transposase [Methanoculleus bourgensis]|uniref:Transposase IS4-like domain-containing protein n=1 Tax=Methanoculleus bourgensis TaxID=83986 RepID=A0A0X3BQ33_9EURY|nr:transposase [Methanoculleus bourgensis]CVK34138.1 conserved protein of unknown function [Methanoculleus bourgensis]